MSFKSQESAASISEDQLRPYQKAIADGHYTPLFNERGGIQDGGLAVLHDGGGLVEVRHQRWIDGDEPAYMRASRFMVRHSGDDVVYDDPSHWDARTPSLGSETEVATCLEDGTWWNVLPDGTTLIMPDGVQIDVADYDLQPEALSRMFEYGTRPVRGYSAYNHTAVRKELQIERLLHQHGLFAPPLNEDPEVMSYKDISAYPYMQRVTKQMPHVLEFVASMTWQQHVQMRSPEAMLAALNDYQAVQALTTLLTHGAPIRDGSFDTTLADHYNRNPNPDFVVPPAAGKLIAAYGADAIPADWRELSRTFGSPSGGTYTEPTPYSLMDVLDSADRLLRTGAIVSTARVLGWHTDRLRLDKGTGEISNIGKAGGNLHKILAVHELGAKLLVALQLYRSEPGQKPNDLFSHHDSPEDRRAAVEAGTYNSMTVAMLGKASLLRTPDNRDAVPPQELLRRIAGFIREYAPEPLSHASQAELTATLHPAPPIDAYRGKGAADVLNDFYRRHSPMTAAEVLVLAHKAEPTLPRQVLQVLMARCRSEHVYNTLHNANAWM